LAGSIAAAAGALGYTALNTGQQLDTEESVDSWVEISMKGSEVIADAMQRESEFTVRKGDVTATFRREPDGRCLVHVAGMNKTDAELNAIGEELLGRVTQQYAYNKVVSEMKSKGFAVTAEEVTSDNTIRIKVSKYV
jgi:hypothetical protein